MKTFFTSGASLLAFVGTSFAQNTSTVNQTGNGQKAAATQVGKLQTSTIQQTQGSASTNYGNYAATQQGTTASPNTGSNEAIINQTNGSQGNRAVATQSGGFFTSTINQNGTNTSTGVSGGLASGSGATAGAAAGSGNFAGTVQQGAFSTAVVNQNGEKVGSAAVTGVRSDGTVTATASTLTRVR